VVDRADDLMADTADDLVDKADDLAVVVAMIDVVEKADLNPLKKNSKKYFSRSLVSQKSPVVVVSCVFVPLSLSEIERVV